jgi:Ser/Thr protein kinase RdoA (MazF antagonist)
MPATPQETAARVLDRYPAPLRGPLVALGNRGGFSGANLWRVRAPGGDLCLRAWPEGEPASRVVARHDLMAVAARAGLTFVPAVLAARNGVTLVEEASRVWELTAWLPGKADFRDHPTPVRLAAAGVALAQLHQAWRGPPHRSVCPAVERRLEASRSWDRARPALPAGDPLHALVGRAHELARAILPHVGAALAPWALLSLPVQPCLCDVWHDHLLFAGDRLTGLIDYGSVKSDNVAADLARMFGSLVGEEGGWRVGLTAYRAVRPLSEDEARLARVLDVTGTVLGVVNWLRWLSEGRVFVDRAAVARRLGELVARVERWGGRLPPALG